MIFVSLQVYAFRILRRVADYKVGINDVGYEGAN